MGVSKINEALRLAYRKGYRVTADGLVENAAGRVRKCQIKRSKRSPLYGVATFGFWLGKSKISIPVHKLQAYQTFGERIFEPGIQIRHVDGNSLNHAEGNISIGTASENMMDRPEEERRAHAAKATAANPWLRTDWEQIERDYFENQLGFKKLSQKYGVSSGTLSNHFNQLPGWAPTDISFDWNAIRAHLEKTGCDYHELRRVFGCHERSCRRRFGSLAAVREQIATR